MKLRTFLQKFRPVGQKGASKSPTFHTRTVSKHFEEAEKQLVLETNRIIIELYNQRGNIVRHVEIGKENVKKYSNSGLAQ